MRHGVKKIKFKLGVDAKQMMLRKLVYNFITRGKMTTTVVRGKILKSYLDKILVKTFEKTEANKNFLMKKLSDYKLVNTLFKTVGPVLKGKTGGFTRLIKLGTRESDAVEMGRLEWVYPVVLETTKPAKKTSKKVTAKTETKIKDEKPSKKVKKAK